MMDFSALRLSMLCGAAVTCATLMSGCDAPSILEVYSTDTPDPACNSALGEVSFLLDEALERAAEYVIAIDDGSDAFVGRCSVGDVPARATAVGRSGLDSGGVLEVYCQRGMVSVLTESVEVHALIQGADAEALFRGRPTFTFPASPASSGRCEHARVAGVELTSARARKSPAT